MMVSSLITALLCSAQLWAERTATKWMSHYEIWIRINFALISHAVNQCASFRSSNVQLAHSWETRWILNVLILSWFSIHLSISLCKCSQITALLGVKNRFCDGQIWLLCNLTRPKKPFRKLTDISVIVQLTL